MSIDIFDEYTQEAREQIADSPVHWYDQTATADNDNRPEEVRTPGDRPPPLIDIVHLIHGAAMSSLP